MRIDPKLARILSSFFLDVAKAYFIGTFVTSTIAAAPLVDTLLLTKGLVNVILFILLAWIFAKME